MEKYLIDIFGEVIAMKYNADKDEIIIGGNKRFMSKMHLLIMEYFRVRIPGAYYPQTDRVKFTFIVTKRKYNNAVEMMKEHGIVLTGVTSIGEVMY